MSIEAGAVVVLVLHTPREKFVGVLEELSPAGVHIRCLELGYFDDWCAAIASDEPHLGMDEHFFPMWRVERIVRDAVSGAAPSLAEHFKARTGRELTDI